MNSSKQIRADFYLRGEYVASYTSHNRRQARLGVLSQSVAARNGWYLARSESKIVYTEV